MAEPYLNIFQLTKPVTAPTPRQTGPYSHEEHGICPVCKEQMVTGSCGTEPVYFCLKHRITMPMPE